MEKTWYSFLYIKSPILKILIGILSVIAAIVIVLVVLVMEESRMAAQTANWNGRSIEKGADLYANNCASCHGIHGQGGAGPALNSRYFFTQRVTDIGFAGSLEDYVQLTIAAGRPSNATSQWTVMMPTWSSTYGGPLRPDQVEHLTNYVVNWREAAIVQTDEEDPWIPFTNAPTNGAPPPMALAPDAGAAPRDPEVIFTQLACAGCHVMDQPQTDSNRGPIGPNLGNLAEHAGTRVPGEDAETYVRHSILEPNAHVVEGYSANLMPAGLADRMSEEEFTALVAWLLEPR